jgi:hypothetical protein
MNWYTAGTSNWKLPGIALKAFQFVSIRRHAARNELININNPEYFQSAKHAFRDTPLSIGGDSERTLSQTWLQSPARTKATRVSIGVSASGRRVPAPRYPTAADLH